jgi:predicted DsbA family dithiol-disulfide isomerase
MQRPHLDIAFVSDVACPWCAIGLSAVEQALARVEKDVDATVTPEPFELNPDMGKEGAELGEYIARKYRRTPEQIAQVQARIRQNGAAVGFNFAPRTHVWNTFDAHRMIYWAGLEGRALDLKRALLRAYHGEGRNPSAPDVLLELAGAVGLDTTRAQSIVESREFEPEVRSRERYWTEQGISGVPFVLVNNAYAIEGAQPTEAFEQAFLQISRSR